ncbi:PilW family protein [Nitrosomonas sp. Nm166]|uniref:PilW family protein n=1 Tax=Nitrosomonas sp. Nm166 TaxID=1881054 RepID=UPI0008EEF711|nr:PilW family protein [Nitrosomonas sp. Nm166]SFD84667.1 type IV pilus assembly protein PilW [Nitrosomonas sp. Nm166]
MSEQISKWSTGKSDHRLSSQQGGFSLIELMISVTLGLLVMTGILALYLDLTRNNAELAKMNRQIENGRFTLQLLQQELWHAGYWDTYVPALPSAVPPTAIPNPCIPFTDWDATYISNMFSIPVQGYAAGTSLPDECSSIVTNRQPDSDVLVIRYAATCAAGVAGCENFNAGKLYLQTQQCTDTGHGNYVSDAATTPVLGAPGIGVYKKDCITAADKRKLIISIFYVRSYSVASSDGIPTLMRADFDLSGGVVKMQSAQPVIEGIQSIQFEYGRDTDEDGSADIFDNCSSCTALDWANIVAVQVHVLARNLETSSGYVDDKTYQLGSTTLKPFNDGYRRHAYTSYVRLINSSGRREKP